MKAPRNRTHGKRYQDARHRLRSAFPELFAMPRHPWKIGIWRDMAKLRPDIMYNRWVSWYIMDFTRGEKYLMSVINGMPRIDVNGVIVEDVKPEHREYARILMGRRMSEKYKIDTSDTHKYGEIWIVNDAGNIVLTVHPVDGDEDSPNYDFAKKICYFMNEGAL